MKPFLRHQPASLLSGSVFGALLTIASASQANTVACHLTYGGETRIVEATPTTSPYSEAPIAIGSRLLFRLVYHAQAADLAGIKLYTYVDRDEGPVLIHQTSYPAPPRTTDDRYGFTGLHFVYEPVRDGELQYWCELKNRP